MSYADLLKDPRWQKKRLEILEASAWKCERCDDKTTELHVHHKRYIKGKMPWEYESGDLCVLCGPHHEEWHADSENLQMAIARMPLQAFENVVGYAVALAAFGGDCFHSFKPHGCNGGGLIAGLYVKGAEGQRLVKESTTPEGIVDVPRLISDSLGQRHEMDSGRDELVEKIIDDVKQLAGLK
jgi:hypothetical protein